MKRFSHKHLYWLIIILSFGLIYSAVHAAQLNIDNFNDDAQVSDVDATACTSVGGGTGTDMMGGERDLLVTRLSGGGVVAEVDTANSNSLAFSTDASTTGQALIQLDGVDGSCALSFTPGLNTSLNPYDGITIFVQQVDLNAVVTMRVYTTSTDYSEFTFTIPYAISLPGTEIYFPFDQFTTVGSGADFGSVDAIEILLDGTTVPNLDMTIDFVASDYSRDYGDLPAAYGNTLDGDDGARHRIGGVYFGTNVDSESDGQESGDATGDQARDDDETGITRSDGDWGDGGGSVSVDVTKPGALSVACVVGWIDWDGDDVFEATSSVGGLSELVANNFYFDDTNISFSTPTLGDYGGTYPSILNARFRIFRPNEPLFGTYGLMLDGAGCPSASSTTDSMQLVFGDATDGEVEDYQWGFGPTAITLSNTTINLQQNGILLVIALTGVALVVTFLFRRRRER